MVKFSLEHVSVDRRQWYSKHIGKLVIFTCIFMTINLQKQNSMELLMEWISSMRGTLESLITCFTTVVCIMLLFIHQFNIVFHLVRILTSLSIKMKVLNIFLHITPYFVSVFSYSPPLENVQLYIFITIFSYFHPNVIIKRGVIYYPINTYAI